MTKDQDTELQLEDLEANLKNSKQELEMFDSMEKTIIEDTDRRLGILNRQLELKKKMHDIAMANFVPLEPAWEFMKLPEYNELRRELSDIEWSIQEENLQMDVKKLEDNKDSQLSRIAEQRKSSELSVKDIEEKIKRLKK